MSKNTRLKKVEIVFDEPVLVSGAQTKKLEMRRQKVQDGLDAEVLAGTSSMAAQEVALFSILCSVPVEDLKQWDSVDYQKLQEGYVFLTVGGQPETPQPSCVKLPALPHGQAGAETK